MRTFESYERFLEAIARREVVVDQWQLEKLALVGMQYEVMFYVPGLGARYRKHFGSRMFSSPEAAVGGLLTGLGQGARVALIPEGPYVLARVLEAQAA